MNALFDRHGLTVTPANVLGIGAVIMTEAEELEEALRKFENRFPKGMPVLGGDPVSPHAARGFTEATGAYLAGCQARIDELRALGAHLAAAARDYGRTEDEIGASFRPDMRHDVSPLVKPVPSTGGILGSYPDPLHPGLPA